MNVIDGKAFLFVIVLFALIVGGIFVLVNEIESPDTIETKAPLKCDTTITIQNGKADTLYIYHLPK